MSVFKHPFLSTLVLVILAAGVFLAVNFRGNTNMQSIASPLKPPQNLLTPTPTAVAQDTQVISPDGNKKLMIKNISNTYSFYVASVSGNKGQPFFTKTVNQAESITIPGNSWSPDNAYAFVQENDKNSLDYLVFRASGERFSNGQQYLDVPSLFSQRNTDYIVKEVTGWAAPGLLIVNTAKNDNTIGPSFWLDMSNQSFIQLATHFN